MTVVVHGDMGHRRISNVKHQTVSGARLDFASRGQDRRNYSELLASIFLCCGSTVMNTDVVHQSIGPQL